MTDPMDVIDPAPSGVRVGGKALEIRPLVVGVLPRLVRTARPVIDAVLDLDNLPDEDDTGEIVVLLLNLIEAHGEKVFEAAAMCIGEDEAWVESLDIAEFAEVAMKVFEVNRDFFAQKLAPLLAARAANKASGGGETASSS